MYTSHQLPPKLIVDKPNNSSSYTSYRSNHLPFTTCVPSLHAKFSLYIIVMFQETPIRASYCSNHFPLTYSRFIYYSEVPQDSN